MKMFFEILTASILIAGCVMFSFAQPAWDLDPYAFEFSMTITAKITTDGEFSEDENDKVAAFVDGNCRGISNVTYESFADGYYLYLMVYSNKPSDTITFKMFNARKNEISNAKCSLIFVVNDIVGSLDSPLIISSEKLNDKAELTNFTITDQIGETLFSNTNLFLQKSTNSVLTGITSSFSVSEGAKVFVNGIRQVSGESINDFSKPVPYTIISADFADTVTYTVFVSFITDSTTIIQVETENSDLILYPNPFKEFLFIEIPYSRSEVFVNIYTFGGKMVMSQRLKPEITNKVRTCSLMPGIYFVILSNKANSTAKKIIKY
jgi:hypothetical protein